jgi:pimeloyl-ACP methyl ester carboxylesterase
LGYAEFGAPGGYPVLCWHGAPASRLMYKIAGDNAARHGLRLIAFDRPGSGLTTPHRKLTLQARLQDAAALVAALELDRFALLAISGGGPYAVAMAAQGCDRISALALVSPLGPLNDDGVRPHLAKRYQRFFLGLPQWQRALRAGANVSRRAYLAAPALHHRLSAAVLPASDRQIVRKTAVRASMIEMMRETFRQGSDCGPDDLTIYSRPWADNPARITAPSFVWYGLADTIVPPISPRTLAARIPGCEVREIPDAGHFWVYDNIDAVMERLRGMIDGGKRLVV